MKLMCIKPDRGGLLRWGAIYTAVGEKRCSCGCVCLIIEEIPEPLAGLFLRWRCGACGFHGPREIVPPYKCFNRNRFVLWNPDQLGITEQEVKELYSPTHIKEKA